MVVPPEKLRWILATDCGSTTTKAILIHKDPEFTRFPVIPQRFIHP